MEITEFYTSFLAAKANISRKILENEDLLQAKCELIPRKKRKKDWKTPQSPLLQPQTVSRKIQDVSHVSQTSKI